MKGWHARSTSPKALSSGHRPLWRYKCEPVQFVGKGPKLTTKEAKSLIVSANTPQDHHKLACYFRAEAREEADKAKYHEEMGQLYAGSSNEKHDMVDHCKEFAEEARKAADSDNQLADEHEKMAEQAK
jgi:hypothetical protein